MKNKFFNIVSDNGHVESAKNFRMADLMKDVKMYETKTHLHIENFPGAFGDTQNKNNRVYDQESLEYAVNQFNSIKDENPYFCYMFDGHKDDDSYENIVGRVVKLHLNSNLKCVYIDMKINKGSRSQSTIRNIMADGDPLGASMRILSPNTINISKDDLAEINPKIVFLDDDDTNIAYLMSKDTDIEYITGDAFIQRFDITQFPSFNDSFVAKPFLFSPEMNKSESTRIVNIPKADSVKLADYREASTLFKTSVKCVTNACQFRHTLKDFVDLISMDESITVIKDNPKLYESMINFSYLNLDSFDFEKIVKSNYLSNELTDNNITEKTVKEQREILDKVASPDNVIAYIMDSTRFDILELGTLLNSTINAVVDEDNVFYQIITINYMHFVILSTIILTGKTGVLLNNKNIIKDKLESTLNSESTDASILVDLIKKMNKDTVNIYDYMNSIFSYIYQYIDEYSNRTAPLTIINESMKIFQPIKYKGVLNNKFVK